jgi:hypothetical protein
MTDDARRMAERFHYVFQALGDRTVVPEVPFDEVPLQYKVQLIKTFDELIKAEVVFPGPSLYAEP